MDKQKAIRVYVDNDQHDRITAHVDENSTESVSTWARHALLERIKAVEDGDTEDRTAIDEKAVQRAVEDATEDIWTNTQDALDLLAEIKELIEASDETLERGRRARDLLRIVSWEEHDDGVEWSMGVEPKNEEENVALKGSPESVAAALGCSVGEAREALIAIERQDPNVAYTRDDGTRRYYEIKNER